jgi:hypothetical protein
MFSLVLCALLLTAATVRADAVADASKLLRDATRNYEKDIYPNNPTLRIGMFYICGSVDEDSHVLTSRVWERITWDDSRLAWKPDNYGGITRRIVPADSIWTPLFKLVNSFPHSEDRDHVTAEVFANGTVAWWVPATLTTLCREHHDDDDTYFCRLRYEMWSQNVDEVTFTQDDAGLGLSNYLRTCPYVVTHSSVKISNKLYSCCSDPYPTYTINLTMKKRRKDHDDDKEEEEEEAKKKSRRWDKYSTGKKACFWPYC